jgi:hypothetical protein
MKKLMLLTGMLVCFFSSFAQITEAEKKTANDLLQKNKPGLGLSQSDLDNSIVTGTYLVPGSDVRMLYLQQGYRDIPVYNRLNVLAFKNEKIVSNAGSRIASLDQKLGNAVHTPAISPEMAVKAAMAESKVSTQRIIVPVKSSANGKKLEYGNLDVSTENIIAELIWFPVNNGEEVKLAWQIFIAPRNSSDYWLIRVDAANGQIINKESLTVYCNWDKASHSIDEHLNKHITEENINRNIQSLEKNNKALVNQPLVVNNASYRVIPYPAESPIHPGGGHALRTNPWTLAPGNATSLGWHFDGTAYHDSTRGNNVYAYEDRDANNLPGLSAVSSTGQPDLTFDFTPDYLLEPVVRTPAPNQQFNTANLFYWNNLIHDLSYIYGFTETARNFQNNNQGRGGAQLDYVLAEAQDGSGTNNANFSTPADGGRGRMQMYLWTAPTPDRDGDVDNGIIIHEYTHGISNRMTGTGSGCLSNAEQMGEGWSDYFGLMMTHDWATALPGDGFSKPRGIGTYALNQPITGLGIRQYRYTTDMAVNPMTYGNLPTVVHPHGTGTIWCTVLWDMTWEIIQTAGINPSLHNIGANGGNAIALKLVTEGLRLQPCSPGFISGRDAILKADTLFYGAQYSCAIINAFARRGMGIGASQGSSASRTDQTLSFVGCTPGACNAPVGLTSSAITTTTATVSWTAVSGAVSYDLDYKLASSGIWINAATGTSSTAVNLTGLTASSLYDWRVRTNCASSSSAYAQAQFTTASPVCNAPVGLTTSAITQTTATVSWTAVSGAVSYDVDYKLASSGTWINAATGTTSTSVNLTGLTASSLYDWRVRTNCASSSSAYAQAQFITATPPSVCPGSYDVATNGNRAGAALIPLNTDVKGTISPVNDIDFYRFNITTGGTITVTLTTLPANYQLDIQNASGNRIGRSRNGGTSNETINLTVAAGDYYARVYSSGSANNATLCYTLRVTTGTASFGDGEMIVDSRIKVFPNPVSKTVTVTIPEIQGQADIRLFDVYGRMLVQKNSSRASTQLDVSSLPPGIYLVKVMNDGKESSIKIVKE